MLYLSIGGGVKYHLYGLIVSQRQGSVQCGDWRFEVRDSDKVVRSRRESVEYRRLQYEAEHLTRLVFPSNMSKSDQKHYESLVLTFSLRSLVVAQALQHPNFPPALSGLGFDVLAPVVREVYCLGFQPDTCGPCLCLNEVDVPIFVC